MTENREAEDSLETLAHTLNIMICLVRDPFTPDFNKLIPDLLGVHRAHCCLGYLLWFKMKNKMHRLNVRMNSGRMEKYS